MNPHAHLINEIKGIKETLETLVMTVNEKNDDPDSLMTIKDIEKMIGFNADWIYKRIARDQFPKPIKIGRSSRWKRSTIIEWNKSLADE